MSATSQCEQKQFSYFHLTLVDICESSHKVIILFELSSMGPPVWRGNRMEPTPSDLDLQRASLSRRLFFTNPFCRRKGFLSSWLFFNRAKYFKSALPSEDPFISWFSTPACVVVLDTLFNETSSKGVMLSTFPNVLMDPTPTEEDLSRLLGLTFWDRSGMAKS